MRNPLTIAEFPLSVSLRRDAYTVSNRGAPTSDTIENHAL
jgi:hypothetical protein